MTVITGPNLRLRPVEIYDWPVFALCFADWPRDEQGFYSNQRAIRDCDVAVARNRFVTEPLTRESDWQLTQLVYTDAVPSGIGLSRSKAAGRTVTVLNQALIPSERGKGHMAELQALLQKYAFDVLNALEAGYEIIPGATGARAHVMGRAKYEAVGQREGRSGTLDRGRITRARWDAWVAAHPEEDAINKPGTP